MVLLDKIKNALKIGKILYYPGCVSKFKQKEIADSYKRILKRLGIDFMTLEIEEQCCGLPLLTSGYKEAFEKTVERNKVLFKNHKITKIITNCPACAHTFKKYYDIDSEHITETMANNIRKIEIEMKNSTAIKNDVDELIGKEKITMHIPCYAAKNSSLVEKIRNLVQKKGLKMIENDENVCCGTGHSPLRKTELTKNIARLTLDRVETKRLMTLCPLCYEHFKENNKQNIEIIEFSELFDDKNDDTTENNANDNKKDDVQEPSQEIGNGQN